jgi:hypothetical protein
MDGPLVIVRKIDFHPKFEGASFGNKHDVAVLTLQEKIKFGPGAFPICLPPPSQLLDQVRFLSSIRFPV